jgi:hypothetical protein
VLHVCAGHRLIEGYLIWRGGPIGDLVLLVRFVDRQLGEYQTQIIKYVYLLSIFLRPKSFTVVSESTNIRSRFEEAFRRKRVEGQCLTLDEYEQQVGHQRFRLEVDP